MSNTEETNDFMVNKPAGTGEFEKVPEGLFIGRCYMLMMMGTQTEIYQGESKQKKKVLIGWELLDEDSKMADGKPFTISSTYTHTLHDNGRLAPLLNAWRGKKFTTEELEGFDLRKILGAYGQIQVIHTKSEDGTKTYANVNSVLPFKGEKPAAVNDNVLFSAINPNVEAYNALPDFLKRRVDQAAEWDNDAMIKLGAVAPKPYDATKAPTNPNRSQSDDVVIEDLDTSKEVDLNEVPF